MSLGSAAKRPVEAGSWVIRVSGPQHRPGYGGLSRFPTAVTLDINVLSWTAGQGGSVRTPTRMQGTYTESSPASDLDCKATGSQQTVSYG